MRYLALTLVMTLASMAVCAASISRNYTAIPLPQTLIDIDKASPDKKISFIYDKLEDFTVTCSFRNLNTLDAVMKVVGQYPLKVNISGDSIITVEPRYDFESKLIGRLIDNEGYPVEFATIRLYNPSDSTFLAGGVSNPNGDFVIPVSRPVTLMKVTSMGYFPEVRIANTGNIGTVTMKINPTELKDVEVKADRIYTVPEGMCFVPSVQEKRVSYDAYSLLRNMNLAQIDVWGNSVKTNLGHDVEIFIDYAPATQDMASNLNPEDVVKVEFLEYPSDPRFGGASVVINFIMRQYVWGGYTKVGAFGSAIEHHAGRLKGYSRMKYKKMTYDASVGADLYYSPSCKSESEQRFNDVLYEGELHQEITKVAQSETKMRSWTAYTNLRAAYETPKSRIIHHAFWSWQDNPLNSSTGSSLYDPAIVAETSTRSRDKSHSTNVGINGQYFFILRNDNTINASFNASYNKSTAGSTMITGETVPILNGSRENAHHLNGSIVYTQNLGHRNKLAFRLATYTSDFDNRYTGSYRGKQTLFKNESMLMAEYSQRLSDMVYIFARLGGNVYTTRIQEGESLSKLHPRLGLNCRWTPDQKHSLNVEAWYANSNYGVELTNTALVRTDLLMWKAGNPEVPLARWVNCAASYNMMATDNFSISLYSSFVGNIKSPLYYYDVAPQGRDGVVRLTDNNVNLLNLFTGSTASWQLNPWLSLRGSIVWNHTHHNGTTAATCNSATWSLRAQYINNSLSASAYVMGPTKSLNNHGINKTPATYGVSVTWRTGNWHLSIDSGNWFNKALGNTMIVNSPHFSQVLTSYNTGVRPMLNCTVVYTIPYGKKVDMNGELGGSQTGTSATLR